MTVKKAKLKAASFCAYRERTQQEVRNKLYSYGLSGDDVEQTIALLLTEGFINEERFAKAYAGGKFRINNWGRVKIRAGLRSKGLSSYCVESGMKEIKEEEYLQIVISLLEKKRKLITEKDPVKVKYKLAQYLTGKGFESEIVWEQLDRSS